MDHPHLEIRAAGEKGRGVFAAHPIARGDRIAEILGWLAKSDELHEDWFALQVGPDLWLCSDGDSLDDCINHACDPNVGFVSGAPVLFALRDIVVGEEIAWDYSTSLAEPGWTLDCCCGSANCRKIVRSWHELAASERDRLRPIALAYLRK